jgi:hypothetical protein
MIEGRVCDWCGRPMPQGATVTFISVRGLGTGGAAGVFDRIECTTAAMAYAERDRAAPGPWDTER